VHAPLAFEHQDLVDRKGAENLGAHFRARLKRARDTCGDEQNAEQTGQR
jgi:hypothetical protein